MRLSFIGKAALGAGAIAVGLAGCAGGGSPISGLPGAASGSSPSIGLAMQRSTVASQVAPAATAISPDLCPDARVYVANFQASDVEVYPSYWIGQPKPCARITHGTLGPSGISVDANGTLYVSDYSYDAVTVFPKGSLTPSLTIPTAGPPQYAYGAPDGTLYVPETYNNQIEVFAAGTMVPQRTIAVTSPWGLTTDRANNLYVVSGPYTGARVLKFAPGGSTGTDLGFAVRVGGIAVTTNGSIVVGDISDHMLDVFPPGKTTPSRSLATINTFQFALDASGTHLFVASSDSNQNGQGVAEYDFKTGVLVDQFSAGTAEPDGIAVYPPAP